MKRLAIFCDGTWSSLRAPLGTNVVRLARSVLAVDPKSGRRQVVYYDDGVGAALGVSRLVDGATALLGGALGRGLDQKIEQAYRFLVLNYEPGDEVHLFGFSRGAYTARSLAGLMRKCGVLRRDCFDHAPEAMRRYRHRAGTDGHAFSGVDAHEVHDERARRIAYLGLWDTVGSLGLPRVWPWAKWFNRRHGFHDTRASGLIAALRHAVAIDEDRKVLGVTEVANVHALNLAWARRASASLEREDPAYVPPEDRPYQQRWFVGDHGAVGGGNPERALSSATLVWVAEGAERAGLALDWSPGGRLAEARRLASPLAAWRIDRDGSPRATWQGDLMGWIGGYRDRRGPETAVDAHPSVAERIAADPGYRPAALQRITGVVGRPPLHRAARTIALTVLLVVVIAVVLWRLIA